MRLAVALALAGIAASASAEQRPAAPAEDVAVVMDRFAQCVGTRWRRSIYRVLQEIPGSSQERDRLGAAISEWSLCTDALPTAHARRIWDPDFIRGPLAENLYEQDFAPRALRPREGFARLPDPVEVVRRRNLPEPVLRAAVIGVFAACVAGRHPAEAAAVLATPPASRAERDAVNVLSPEFGACFPAGSQFDITIPLLRGYLAAALYRRAAALAAAPVQVRQ